jgi:predicted GTPase
MTTPSLWSALRHHHRRQLALLGMIALLILIPWIIGMGAGVWLIVQQGWAWYWWGGSLLLLALALLLLRRLSRNISAPLRLGSVALPGASVAEQEARERLRARIEDIEARPAEVWQQPDAVSSLLLGALQDVAEAYSPGDAVALWRFTLPELLLMVEDISRQLRQTLVAEVPVLRHLELSWVMLALGLSGTVGKWMSLVRLLKWVNPTSAMTSELRARVIDQALDGLGSHAKAQIAVALVEQVGEAAIKLYAGGYRRRIDELPVTAATPLADRPAEPLTVLIAGRRNAGKSALLNALLGNAREPVGLLTAGTEGCRAYAFKAEQTGDLVLVDCPGVDPRADAERRQPWLAQAAKSDLVLWVTAANQADRAADQQALAALDALDQRDRTRRRLPRVLVLTHADQLDPPQEWAPPYDLVAGQRLKERQMREARDAVCKQLDCPVQQAALIAIRPGEPIWNRDGLYQAIRELLPEAQQKQLERGMAKEGWFKRTADTVNSVPAAFDKTTEFVKKTLAGSAGSMLKRWTKRD